jgi:hypothetical protein
MSTNKIKKQQQKRSRREEKNGRKTGKHGPEKVT